MMLKFILCIFLVNAVGAQNFGIFSDIHLKLNYDPRASNKKCEAKSSIEDKLKPAKETALLGRLGCDPPTDLVEYMMQLF